jgi:hypothetical protein
MEVQGSFVYLKFLLPQRLQSLWRHGTGRQSEAGGAQQALLGLPDFWSRSNRPILPLQGGAGRRMSETAMQSQTPPPSTLRETSDEGQLGGKTSCQADRRGYGSDTNRGARIRGATGRSMGQHQGRRALLSLLGHRLPGDPHYP